METLLNLILKNRNARAKVHILLGMGSVHVMSYAELKQRALGLHALFFHKGVAKGDEIILVTQHMTAFIEGFWAAVMGSNPAVPVSLGIADEHKRKLFRIWKQLRSPWLLIDTAQKERLESFARLNDFETLWQDMLAKSVLVDQITQLPQSVEVAEVTAADTAIIQFSSGTTGIPKGVVLSHKNVLTNIRGIVEGTAMNAGDSTFSWMPLTHDMGLIGFHLTPLFYGIDQHLMLTDTFIRHPALWMEEVSRRKVTITCSPNFGYRHYLNAVSKNPIKERLELSHVRLIFNGAEPISVSLAEQFLSEMAIYGLKDTVMFPVYGLAEASLAVAFPEVGTSFRYLTLERGQMQLDKPVAFANEGVSFAVEGKAVLGCQIQVVGSNADPLPANHIGRIEIKGDNVTEGYLGQEELNQELIHTRWLDTGDMGFLTDAGELVVTGRLKDIIFLNGQNFYPHDIEQVLEHAGVIEQGKVAVTAIRDNREETDKVLVFVSHKAGPEAFLPLSAAIRKAVNQQLGVEVYKVIALRQLPKTTSGKMQRYVLGDRYLLGEFDEWLQQMEAITMEEESTKTVLVTDIEKSLKQICDRLITTREVGLEENIFEIGTTSLVLAQIHQQIEEVYPGKVEVTDFFDYPTIRELAVYIDSKQAS